VSGLHFGGELWPTFQKLHQNTWEDVSISFPHSDVSAVGPASRILPHRQFVEARSEKYEEEWKHMFSVNCCIKPEILWHINHRLRARSVTK
jgi:hypothetical protein